MDEVGQQDGVPGVDPVLISTVHLRFGKVSPGKQRQKNYSSSELFPKIL